MNAYAAYRSTNSLGANNGEPWVDHFKNFKYAFTSVGIGLTTGYELTKENSQSLLLQIDATMTNNNLDININPKREYNNLSYHYNSYQNKLFSPWKRSNKNVTPVVSGSISRVFFKSPLASRDPFRPFYPLQKSIFDPETGKTINRFNGTSYFEKDKFTEKQLVYLAKKNAQEKHFGALWSVLGLTGVPCSAFGSVFDLLVLGKVIDRSLAFTGFILGGVFGATLPSILAKGSSRLANTTCPPEIETKEKEVKYKRTYKSEIALLRQKSTAIGTLWGFVAFAAFIMLVIVGT